MTPRVVLVEMWPRRPTDGVAVPLRVIGGATTRADHFETQWLPALARMPRLASRLGFDGRAFGQGAISTVGEIVVALGSEGLAPFPGYIWSRALVTIKIGPADGLDDDFTLFWTGRAADVTAAGKQMVVRLADPAEDLQRQVLPNQFKGSGGLEGPPDMKGRVKPRAWGTCENVPAILIDPAFEIYMLVDGEATVDAVKDGGVPFSVGPMAVDLVALQTLTVPPGSVAISSSGDATLIRPWTRPTFTMTADITAGALTKPAEIAHALVASRTAVEFAPDTAAEYDAAQPGPIGLYVDDERTLVDELDRIFAGLGSWWKLNAAGEIEVGWFGLGGANTQTFGREIAEVTRQSVLTPTRRRLVGYRRNFRTLGDSEIAGALKGLNWRGSYKETDSYAINDAVHFDGQAWIAIAVASGAESPAATPEKWSLLAASGAVGPQGPEGLPGPKGNDGQTLYTWVAYADNTDGTANFTTGAPTGRKYIGLANNKTSPTESQTPSDYVWSKFAGEDGVPGSPGADGQPTYTWFAYADSANGLMNFTTGAPDGRKYIGIAPNKISQSESSNPADYTWSLFVGADGAQGAKGDQGNVGAQGPEGPSSGLSMKINVNSVGTPNDGELSLHGLTNGVPDLKKDGYIYWNGEKITVPRNRGDGQTVVTGGIGSRQAFIMFDTAKPSTPRFVSFGSRSHIVAVYKDNTGQWRYDNNEPAQFPGIPFTPIPGRDVAIGWLDLDPNFIKDAGLFGSPVGITVAAFPGANRTAEQSANLYHVNAAGVVSSRSGDLPAGDQVTFGKPDVSGEDRIHIEDVGLAAGDIISTSALIRANTPSRHAFLRIRFWDQFGSPIIFLNSQNRVLADQSNYEHFELTEITVPAGTYFLQVQAVRFNSESGTVYIKNAMVNRGPVAAPYTSPTRGATKGASWLDNLKDRPLELTDGRIPFALSPTGRLWDSRRVTQSLVGGVQSVMTASPVSATQNNGVATIFVAAHSRYYDFGAVSYNGGSIGGLSTSTIYYVYADDPDYTGGAVTWHASTNIADAIAPGRIYLGRITTPATASGTGGETTVPRPEDCVAANMFLSDGRTVGDIQPGDLTAVMDDNMQPLGRRSVISNTPAQAHCVRLVTKSAQVVVSASAPVVTTERGTLRAIEVCGLTVGVLIDGVFGLEVVEAILSEGSQTVARIRVGGISYAGGTRPDRLIFTHNPFFKP